MNKAHWEKLPQDQAVSVMRTIGDAADSAVFSLQMTEVTCRKLPFYKQYQHFRLTNYATMPCFKMDYLGDPETGQFFPLNGLANTLYDVNDNDQVELDANTVVDYIDFFFAQVQGPDGDIYLIKSPDALPMLPSLPQNQQDSVREHFQNMKVDSTDNGFVIAATLYYGGTMIAADISVKKTGQISVGNQRLLLRGIHFPTSPVDYTYMDDET